MNSSAPATTTSRSPREKTTPAASRVIPNGTSAPPVVTTVANIAPSAMKAPARIARTNVRVASRPALAAPRSEALAAMAGGSGASAAPGGAAPGGEAPSPAPSRWLGAWSSGERSPRVRARRRCRVRRGLRKTRSSSARRTARDHARHEDVQPRHRDQGGEGVCQRPPRDPVGQGRAEQCSGSAAGAMPNVTPPSSSGELQRCAARAAMDTSATITSDVPIARRSGKCMPSASMGTTRKPPPTPKKPVSAPTTMPAAPASAGRAGGRPLRRQRPRPPLAST